MINQEARKTTKNLERKNKIDLSKILINALLIINQKQTLKKWWALCECKFTHKLIAEILSVN